MVHAVDGAVPKWFGLIVEMTLQMIAEMGVVVTVSPAFILPSAVIAALGAWIGQLYMKAQLAVKRERSNAKAPVLGHFGAAFVGLSTVLAISSSHGLAYLIFQLPFARMGPRICSRGSRMFASTSILGPHALSFASVGGFFGL